MQLIWLHKLIIDMDLARNGASWAIVVAVKHKEKI